MQKGKSIYYFLAFIIAVPVIIFCIVSWYEKNYQSLPVYPETTGSRFSFALADQQGETFSEIDLEGKIIVADFFFTHCPSICPKMTKSLEKVQRAYGANKDLAIYSFSVDPERDSIPQMQSYASRFNIQYPQWKLLTGEKQTIYRLARKRFAIVATDGDGGPNDFIHSEQLVLLDKKGTIRGYYDGTDPSSVEQLLKDLAKLLNQEMS